MSDLLSDDFDRLLDQGGGLLNLYIVGWDQLPSLAHAALFGDVRSAQLMRAAMAAIDNLESAPEHGLVPCGSCQRPVKHRTGYRVGIALPDADLPLQAMAFPLCSHCCSTAETMEKAAIQALYDIWPSAKAVVITHPEGDVA